MTGEPTFAVVVPFFNERSSVDAVCLELKTVVEKELPGCEVVLVDDGSSDGTAAALDDLGGIGPTAGSITWKRTRGNQRRCFSASEKQLRPSS